MTMDEREKLVEDVARAISEAGGAGDWEHAMECARAALSAIPTTCWLYVNKEGHRCVQFRQGLMDLEYWTEYPLGVVG